MARAAVDFSARGPARPRRRAPRPRAGVARSGAVESTAERFVSSQLEDEAASSRDLSAAEGAVAAADVERTALRAELDDAYSSFFSSLAVPVSGEDGPVSTAGRAPVPSALQRALGATDAEVAGGQAPAVQTETFALQDEEAFSRLGRDDPDAFQRLLRAAQADAAAWSAFQERAHEIQLRLARATADLQQARAREEEARLALAAAKLAQLEEQEEEQEEDEEEGAGVVAAGVGARRRIVLITGFESFNVRLYEDVASAIAQRCPGLELRVFSDRDITDRRDEVDAALTGADAFFGSLLFDFDQVEWLRDKVAQIPVRLVFESGLELMSSTKVGTFTMAAPGGKKAGPPPVVKAILSKFGSGKEEDKLVGYLSFLKMGPKLLRFIPGEKARHLKNWLQIYAYWNQGGKENVEQAFLYLADQYLVKTGFPQQEVLETPAIGVYHPDREAAKQACFESPADYLSWYRSTYSPSAATPVVAVLLYRKHVITRQPYIGQLVRTLEEEGILPVPIFINGVEAHTVVRDLITTAHEQQRRSDGVREIDSLKRDAVIVDAVVNTIGFPLVGGPAGTMEAGRQADVAKNILAAKNVPYVVAAPLLIQDIASWVRDGIAGLQSVVLYALPELDGAVDTVTLGGLVGNDIYLAGERCIALARRLKKWIGLRRTPPAERKVACLVYGFPPGVGATGTAALLNVPRSIDALVARLVEEGYTLGAPGQPLPTGEAIIEALRALEDEMVASRGTAGTASALQDAGHRLEGALAGVGPAGSVVDAPKLKRWMQFPREWGPTEWGPMPSLPASDTLVKAMERNWGDLEAYTGMRTATAGGCNVSGVQVGNVFFGVQPALGLEGDPMRLLFERDLTPHPQYVAFYKWLQNEYDADVLVHFGMHGTVEWLPGSPLGNTGFSWSEALLGSVPNVYVYAANNPSESIVAKRRGYGTMVSHNVPPYGRAGLYKQMAELRELLQDYRGNPLTNDELRKPIADALVVTGLQEDCPYVDHSSGDVKQLTAENVGAIPAEDFEAYASTVYQYLSVVENRLFSEGLHTFGQQPSETQLTQYLEAYFGDDIPSDLARAVASSGDTAQKMRARMEHLFPAPADEGSRDVLAEAVEIRDLLKRSREELDGVVRAMNGEYILPAAGGDLLRDGPGVLPTGRNIHALDPYRMPSPAAMQRGTAVARAILDQHRAENDGEYPETVTVNLWGLDAIKTKGESVAIVLEMVGARPVKEATGRVVRYELVPLEELGGRPRVDVLCSMSGIFRDTFANVVDLLDDLFQRAAAADEPAALNMIKKHAGALSEQGITNGTARIFSNPPGDYGSMVNERVGASDWESGSELGDTWKARNAYSYGRGAERGAARPEVLQQLLSTTDRVVQEIDSVEYGLSDIQEYYANTGALVRAAADEKRKVQGAEAQVACSVVETFSNEVQPKSLDETLRLEYRTKLLNPRWAEAMAAQGSGGAYEISQRMTALVGWGATTEFQEQWVYEGAHERYVDDTAMQEQLRKSNPQAFQNVVRRMLEAAGRGFWEPSEEQMETLRRLYAEMDDELEGVR
mmetsp:Transcript_1572/g.5385  ORF Transcript_1572/g.5385 Transcript_1572/m.5385 type:complete len:1547 (-) Transcript_1572:1607-6247(-)